jgi:hypothetical protein
VLLEKGVVLDVKPGDELDVVGFPTPKSMPDRLLHSEARKIGSGKKPDPIPGSLAKAEERNYTLVQIAARVVEWQPLRNGEVTALLSSGNELFAAVLPAATAQRPDLAYPAGSAVLANGVMKWLGTEMHGVPRAALWLRDPSDLRLLHPAPASPWKWVTLTSSIAAVTLLVAGAVIVILMVRHRRDVGRMSVHQSQTEQRFEEMERQLHR